MVGVLERPITVHPDPYTLYTGNLSEPVKLVNTYSGSIPYQDTLQFVLKRHTRYLNVSEEKSIFKVFIFFDVQHLKHFLCHRVSSDKNWLKTGPDVML